VGAAGEEQRGADVGEGEPEGAAGGVKRCPGNLA
jgi:hypothetical protein